MEERFGFWDWVLVGVGAVFVLWPLLIVVVWAATNRFINWG